MLVQQQGATEPQVIMVEGGAPLDAIEADTVARHIGSRQAPSSCLTWQESLGTMATRDAWRRSVGLVFDVEGGG